ncbi:hypothetical protein WJX81_007447 [Elliptochloris bilobata]|uniref:Uncharacterized protein n=1 Tax=Elliptochloris bilobata TaxID=381761 RepID=A0AAW1S6G2_9CHLO
MALRKDIAARIQKQVEFYFSDSNLPRDPFLCSKVEENPEGFVDLALICSFSRMAQALSIPPKGPISPQMLAQVTEVLRGSSALVVSEDGRRVRRSVPLVSPEEVAHAIDARSLYAAPFPYNATLDNLTAFFDAHAPVNCVRQRRHLASKDFKGSCFVEFADTETATKVLGMALEYAGAPLALQRKQDFIAKKAAERQQAKQARVANGISAAAAAVPPSGDAPGEAASGGAVSGGGDEAAGAEPTAAQPAAEEVPVFVPACVVHFEFEAEEAAEDVGYPEVKTGLGGRDAGIFYVEYQKGDKQGLARCKDADSAKALLERDGGTVTISGQDASLRLLEGEEELAFYKRMADAKRAKDERYGQSANGRGGFAGRKRDRDFGGRGGHGGRGRGRGRGGGRRGRGSNKRGRH